MANQQSLTTAMDNMTLIHNASSNLLTTANKPAPTPSRPRSIQHGSLASRITKTNILGQWEQDRFGTGQPQERSTVSSWQAFAQSNTSKPLPPLRCRDTGAQGASRNGIWRAGAGAGIGPGCQRLPTLPTLPTLPSAPPRGPARASSPSRPYGPRPSALESITLDQALRKRKNDVHAGHNGDTSGNAPRAKRASPDRPSPLSAALSAALSGDIASTEIATSGGNFQHSRKPSFERWVSSRTRPHMVAPNGTTIIPSSLQTQKSTPQYQSSTTASPHVTTENGANSSPESQPRKSSLTNTSPSSHPQPPSLPPQPSPSTNPSTLAHTFPGPTSSPPKSRAKTTDDIARRLIFAGIGAGRVPKRTEEELKKRQEEQEKRRVQREEREKLGKEEVMKWCGLDFVKPEVKPAAQVTVKQELIQSIGARPGVNELTKFNGKEIQW
ncbi:hypothetical protein DL98DRAFT_592154 [Cadophora sp. DSE1049]|nr:hypothetical protein DL98DRAFT_592154 [Cadophora sp. DSE1049]